MKKYKNKEWILDQLSQGKRNNEIAIECGTSMFTISSSVANILNSLTINELVRLVYTCKNPKQLISPKTSAYKKIVDATNFLSHSAQIRERCWYLWHKTEHPPKCKICDNFVKWDHTVQNFREFCSTNCSSKDAKIQTKREETNLINHGVKHPASSKVINDKRKRTLLERYGVEHQNQRHMETESLLTLQNKNKLNTLIEKSSTFEIADELNVSQSVVSKYLRFHNLTSPRKPSSASEREIFDFIASNVQSKIICNSRQIIPPKEIDIFIPDLNLAFEFNGLFWHSDLAGKNKHYHINKTLMCERKNIRLIHIFEHKWRENSKLIKSRVLNLLNSNPNRIFARKCSIVDRVETKVAKEFFTKNHIQGFSPASYYIGLIHNNKLISLMSFGKSRYTKKYDFELIRFCSEANHSVVGGASKIFSYFIKKYNPQSIITYSDKTWNTGNVYQKMGFNFSHASKPNYYYFNNTNCELVYSRVKFQKHKLQKTLNVFNPLLTEWENMKNNNFNRFWDCGNDVFVWRNNYSN